MMMIWAPDMSGDRIATAPTRSTVSYCPIEVVISLNGFLVVETVVDVIDIAFISLLGVLSIAFLIFFFLSSPHVLVIADRL